MNEEMNVEEQVAAGQVVDFEEIRRRMKFQQLRKRAFEYAMREAVSRVDPTVTVEIGGREYTLEYSLRTCRDLYKRLGKNPGQQQITDGDLDDPDTLAAVIWHGIQKHHRDDRGAFTEDGVLDINVRQLLYIRTCVAKALSAILPDEELLKRVELEMSEDPEFRPFVQGSGSTG